MPRKPKELNEESYVKWINTLSKKNLVDLVLRLKKELEYEGVDNCNLRLAMQTAVARSSEHFRKKPWSIPALQIPTDFIMRDKKGVYP